MKTSQISVSLLFLIVVATTFVPQVAMAWGEGHNSVATLLDTYMPEEVKTFLTPENRKLLQRYCHYPDLPNKTLEQTAEIVGTEDAEFLRAQGYNGSDWLHRHIGRATSYVLLCKAFREKNAKNAAFYLSVLSHSVADQGAINHTPILQFTSYSHFEGVKYGIRNSCELCLTDALVARLQEHFKDYEPKLLVKESPSMFSESVYALVLDCYHQAEVSAEIEIKVAFGTPEDAENAMVRIVTAQLESLLDMLQTAWEMAKNKSVKIELTPKMTQEIFARESVRRRLGNPETQAVYDGLFDASKNPENPKATVGLVCEPFGSFHVKALSYVGKMLVASAGRTLRDHGYAVHGVSLWKLETEELPTPQEMPILLIFAGRCTISDAIAETIRRYTAHGGKLLYVGGMDPKNITGMEKILVRCENHEVPVSTRWGIQNEEIWDDMKVAFSPEMTRLGIEPYRFVRNPNFDGFCKPACILRLEVPQNTTDVTPLAWLDNGTDTFCVAAKCGQTVWAPEYLFLPFLFSDATTLRWSELRLDPFGEKVLMDMIEKQVPPMLSTGN